MLFMTYVTLNSILHYGNKYHLMLCNVHAFSPWQVFIFMCQTDSCSVFATFHVSDMLIVPKLACTNIVVI